MKSIMEHIELPSVCYSDYTRHTVIIDNYCLFPMLQDIGYFYTQPFSQCYAQIHYLYCFVTFVWGGSGVRIGVV